MNESGNAGGGKWRGIRHSRCFRRYSISSAIAEQGEMWDESKPVPVHRTRLGTDLMRVVDTVQSLVSTTETLFQERSRGTHSWLHMHPLGRRFVDCLKVDAEQIERHFLRHKLNPAWKLFADHLPSLVMQRGLLYPQDAQVLNFAVSSIRSKAKSDGFVRALDNERRTMQRNEANLRRDVSALRERYRRLVVIRIDLSYLNQFGNYRGVYNGEAVSDERVTKDRARFLRFLKEGPFSHAYLWCAWKQESGVEKGPHTHYLIFFHGKKVRNDAAIAFRLIEHWVKTITDGVGVGFNCNARKAERYLRVGIGRLRRDDDQAYAALFEVVLTYLTKVDYYFRAETTEARRAFQRSQLPWKRSPAFTSAVVRNGGATQLNS